VLPSFLKRSATATLSSTHSANYPASKCVDGDLNNFCASHRSADPSLTLDLGTAIQIAYVAVYNRRDCCQSRLGDYTVSYRARSTDPWTVCAEETAAADAIGPLLSECPQLARYVMIKLPGSSTPYTNGGSGRILNLAEVEVYSFPPSLTSGVNGWDGCGAAGCNRCEGDCDDDSDCRAGLRCFHREATESVPGCSGDGIANYDYCIPPVLTSGVNGWDGCGAAGCNRCEGDCDDDSDCRAGLRCFQRGATGSVPGCSGDGIAHSDYCIPPDSPCDCDYHHGGCQISQAAPALGQACKCTYEGAWTCSGENRPCSNPNSPWCATPDKSVASCALGGGDCGGYDGASDCDCDYHPGGCSISQAAPAYAACKCKYLGFWTCDGEPVRCHNEASPLCATPDKSVGSCVLGGGDCDGYDGASCDCDYKSHGIFSGGGCKVSQAAPAYTACKCTYEGFFTCSGEVVRCNNEANSRCATPDETKASCNLGGGDCGGH